MKPPRRAQPVATGALSTVLLASLALIAGTAAADPILSASKVDALLVDVDGDGEAEAGDVLRYSVGIDNSGDTEALAVSFSDVLDANSTLVVGSVTTSQGTIVSGNSAGDTAVLIDIGTIGVGASVFMSFDALINAGISISVTEISNQGTVSGDNFASLVSDDPDVGGATDPTVTSISHETEPVPEPATLAIFGLARSGLRRREGGVSPESGTRRGLMFFVWRVGPPAEPADIRDIARSISRRPSRTGS